MFVCKVRRYTSRKVVVVEVDAEKNIQVSKKVVTVV
jgi:hypothetical protein